jgi:hypothetical protein
MASRLHIPRRLGILGEKKGRRNHQSYLPRSSGYSFILILSSPGVLFCLFGDREFVNIYPLTSNIKMSLEIEFMCVKTLE